MFAPRLFARSRIDICFAQQLETLNPESRALNRVRARIGRPGGPFNHQNLVGQSPSLPYPPQESVITRCGPSVYFSQRCKHESQQAIFLNER